MAGLNIKKIFKFIKLGLFCASLSLAWVQAAEADITNQPAVQQFIKMMVKEQGFKKKDLEAVFKQANFEPKIIETMVQPLEGKPWYQYQKILVGEPRISQGVQFWDTHAADLARAQKEYGVPAEVIVAIIGIESNYGRAPGTDRIVDSLSTLGFTYPVPARAQYFRQELAQYLILTREQHLDPLKMTGSYAGAIGMPQFMPSSYRAYGVDFSGKGQIDLENNPVDAIGSVAHYLQAHGWQRNSKITAITTVTGKNFEKLNYTKLAPLYTATQLKQAGIQIPAHYPKGQKANLIALDGEQSALYWLGYKNFYAITAYNPSNLYAMAVYQLAQTIRIAHHST